MSDLISRQDVIDALYDWSNHSMTDAETWHIRQVIGDIKSMPSAQPETGRWTWEIHGKAESGGSLGCATCSECGKKTWATAVQGELNFCPNCGADMREAEDE